ncbi:EAL domain-containing protein [Vibrio maerlii]|uniref:EAL domain-containing protein n=1 Tax=Vibrio maerlii TaxID=2231648 RepID=UPI000E3B9D88|nr:EAL domain-containing protein [Vibrio maerlii]
MTTARLNYDIAGNVSQDAEGLYIAEFEGYLLSSVFQPIFNKNLDPIGAEALLRISTDSGEVIPPSIFFSQHLKTDIELAYAESLSRHIHIRNFSQSEYAHLKLFLNVLPNNSHSMTSNEIESVMIGNKVIAPTSLSSEQIVMEVLEQDTHCESTLSRTTGRLAQEGFIIAIDDYGTKASNDYRIAMLKPDIVKLDRTIIEDYCKGQSDKLKAGLEAAKSVGAQIIAEGIETADQFRRMRLLGIDMFQGYYLAHPHIAKPL